METGVLEGKVKIEDDLYECETVNGQEIWTYLKPIKVKGNVGEAQQKFVLDLIQGFDISTVADVDVSSIIECLSRFQNSYAPCGKHRNVDIGRAYIMGDMDWCLHNCSIDIYSCKAWMIEDGEFD